MAYALSFRYKAIGRAAGFFTGRACFGRVALLAVVLLLAGCTTEEIRETRPEKARVVRALFSPNGLGDLSYTDDVLRGILREQTQNDFSLEYHSPSDWEEAAELLARWRQEDTDPGRYYTLLAGSEYEPLARRLLATETSPNYLLFEVSGPGFGFPTFRMAGYGVSFLAGVAAYTLTGADTAAYLGGQQNEAYIRECYDGFRAGYLHAGGREVAETYLSAASDGFAMPRRAYQMADSLFRLYPFLYAVAGGSNNGVYKYLREHPASEGYTAGVDVDQSAYSDRIIGSALKNIGACTADYLRRWSHAEANPLYTLYDLQSGYVAFQVAEAYREGLGEVVQNHVELAIAQEKTYEKEKN